MFRFVVVVSSYFPFFFLSPVFPPAELLRIFMMGVFHGVLPGVCSSTTAAVHAIRFCVFYS